MRTCASGAGAASKSGCAATADASGTGRIGGCAGAAGAGRRRSRRGIGHAVIELETSSTVEGELAG